MTNFKTFFQRIGELKGASVRVLVLACAANLLHAQSYYGGVRGTVSDPNAGAVVGSKVTLINEGT